MMPFLTKRDIQNNSEELIAKNYSQKSLIKDMTGGSTGSPLVFYYDKKQRDRREAIGLRHNHWAGWEIGDKAGVLWGALKDINKPLKIQDKIRNLFLREGLTLNVYSLTEKKMFDFAKKLIKFKPKIILAYANAIYFFAQFLQANNISGINPEAIVCSAEVLTPESRELIEKVFKCKIFNRYGCREVAMIASECEMHRGMHISADSLYVEFIRDGKAVSNGEMGEIVITDLLNYAMPLIRYKIGDVGMPLAGICECGRSLPLMDNVQGRVTDFIITPEGRIIAGSFALTISNIKGIKQIQFVQEKIDLLKVRIVKNKFYNKESENKLLNNLCKFLGNKLIIQLEFVESIPKEVSGKYRFSISNIFKGF
jgi:phenylacetate-CoA ligase